MSTAEGGPAKKGNWVVRHKVWSGVIGAVLLIVIISVAAGGAKKNNTALQTNQNAAAGSPSASTAPPATSPPATSPPSTSPPTTEPPATAPPTTIPQRQVKGSAKTLGAGSFTGGTDVADGLYDVTPGSGQSGNFIVSGTDTYDEILGGTDGVPKVRVQISDGDSIQISSLTTVYFTPVTTPLVTTHKSVTLYAGTWTVGEDLGSGRYVATPGSGQSGNFIITAENVDEILGGSDGVPSVTFTVGDGDIIDISSLSSVTLTAQ